MHEGEQDIIYKKRKKKNVNREFTEIYKRIKEAYQ